MISLFLCEMIKDFNIKYAKCLVKAASEDSQDDFTVEAIVFTDRPRQ
jgi:hypothetical protein